MLFDHALDIDYFLAVRAPPEDLIKERAMSLTPEDEINQRRDQRNRHKGEVAYVIEQHLELEDEDVAKKLPALVAAGFDGRRVGRAHGPILNRLHEGEKFRVKVGSRLNSESFSRAGHLTLAASGRVVADLYSEVRKGMTRTVQIA